MNGGSCPDSEEYHVERTMSVPERENARVGCPTCNGTKVVPPLAPFRTQTSRKS